LRNGVFQVLVKDVVYAAVKVGIANNRKAEGFDLAFGSFGDADQAEVDANGLRRQCGHSGFAGEGQHRPSVHSFFIIHRDNSGLVVGETFMAERPSNVRKSLRAEVKNE
jgi:hypothetical protein